MLCLLQQSSFRTSHLNLKQVGGFIPENLIYAYDELDYQDVKVTIEEYPASAKLQIQYNDLVPVEQVGWKKRRTCWANVLIAFLIVAILGVGIGISYWKLYMNN